MMSLRTIYSFILASGAKDFKRPHTVPMYLPLPTPDGLLFDLPVFSRSSALLCIRGIGGWWQVGGGSSKAEGMSS